MQTTRHGTVGTAVVEAPDAKKKKKWWADLMSRSFHPARCRPTSKAESP